MVCFGFSKMISPALYGMTIMFLAIFLFSCLLQSSPLATPVSGCPEGLWGNNCQYRCDAGCKLGCKQNDGKCLGGCKPGWTGKNCDKLCTDYFYGFNCKSSCGHCYEEKPCNVVTGKCTDGCLPGWQGDKCLEGCKPYTYGANCNNTCGHCRLNQACNAVTGRCSAGCDRGWLGTTCEQACEKGFHGVDCVDRCGHCKANTTCDHVTGKCDSGCAPGWTGLMCTELCRPGLFGPNCQATCGSCLIGSCDHMTGECNGGCARGFHGPQCKEELLDMVPLPTSRFRINEISGCPSGFYGENCSLACGRCQKQTSCDPVNGICKDGCASGYYGVHCFQNCTAGTYGESCKFLCGRCLSGTTCDVQTGICLSRCEDGWEGERCDTGVQRTSNTFHTSPTFPVLIICLVAAVILISVFFTYFVVVRPRKTALRRLYNTSSNEHLSNTYEQIVGSPWELQRGQLSLSNELLGNGQFGQVKRGHVKINGVKVPVAIKSLKDNASAKDKRDFLNELSILKRVGKHENVVCLVGACHIKGVMYVAMEYAKHGDLRTFLRHSRRLTSVHEYDNTTSPSLHTALRPQSLIKLSLDTAKGLKHLADKQIIHRDVAARNVLLGEKLVAKIADFGLSKNDQTYVKTSSTRVPIRWMAVESLFNNTYTLQSDVWSFGVLLWEIFTLGGTPYSSIDSQQLFSYLKDGHRLRKPRLCDQDMYGMMLQCWNDVPERRPTIDELTARLQRMLENSQVYMNITVQEESFYSEIDHDRENSNSNSNSS
ncbi:angiopoietin-1 receptor-like isoform X2 [Biomphalaria glabrata]|uniref:receptor protein-tyrosine kinase n=1 Tax=Biomphalaria glabrata TaxID=6526 RepID=A0A9W3AF39_BIOGL|nr:angiopoietin-1 receptor-like isoform X2 [Biomphalaria glabrata]